MSDVGAPERIVQNRVVKLFRNTLNYNYLGNWIDRENNSNIEEKLLRSFLKEKQEYDDGLISKAIRQLKDAAGNQSRTLYDNNKEVYSLLRYGVEISPDIGENKQKVWFIDWDHPEENNFAIAEEVTILGENKKRPDIVLYVNGIALGVLELKRSNVQLFRYRKGSARIWTTSQTRSSNHFSRQYNWLWPGMIRRVSDTP